MKVTADIINSFQPVKFEITLENREEFNAFNCLVNGLNKQEILDIIAKQAPNKTKVIRDKYIKLLLLLIGQLKMKILKVNSEQ